MNMASTVLNLSESSTEGKSIPNILPSNSTSEIPNGGVVAWIQCAGSFFLFFNCWGVVNTFGKYAIGMREFRGEILNRMPFFRGLPNILRAFSATI